MRLRLTHLALTLALAIVLGSGLGIYLTYQAADQEFRDLLDEDLEQQTELLARLMAASPGALSDTELRALLSRTFRHDDEETLLVTITDLQTRRQLSNLDMAQWPSDTNKGRVTLQFDGHDWSGRQYRHEHILVQLLRRDDLYRELQGDIAEDIITPALASSGLTLLLLAALVGLVLWPLSRLIRQLEQRSAQDLSPLKPESPLREVAVVSERINQLMTDIAEVLERERRFAGELVHELRTPLTTLKLELACEEPDLPAISAEVERMARVVEQLLLLVRLDQGRWHHSFARQPLRPILAAVLERFGRRLPPEQRLLSSQLADLEARVEPTLLGILLDNLLSNTRRHCPAGTAVTVSLRREHNEVVLEVTDTGPGISPPLRASMGQGHTRLDSKSQGLGLGLAICHQIARAHGGRLTFLAREDGAPGLRVRLAIPF
ncbi:histidine kinase [Oceanimonas sp. GK1]|uniref:sensor histidine kinase n=1 Tax=Oceanimonas sp. (strain GK1 / IBRC-M 10197) TaxID=511062 RepID=UPI00024950FC|nr:ATP-binding protein [Oceanimonas sp. GK1]AEY02244.1 histidine kinase [Oceanimonas sp. GK1]